MQSGNPFSLSALPSAQALAMDFESDFVGSLIKVTFSDRALLGNQLAVHSKSEALGSDFIYEVARASDDGEVHRQLSRHATDEAKHARIYDALSRRLGWSEDEGPQQASRSELRSESTRADFDGSMTEFMLSLHVAEIRNNLMLNEYIERVDLIRDLPFRSRFRAALNVIRDDEARHIATTLPFISSALRSGALSLDEVDAAFAEFRVLLWDELGEALCAIARSFKRHSYTRNRGRPRLGEGVPEPWSSGLVSAAPSNTGPEHRADLQSLFHLLPDKLFRDVIDRVEGTAGGWISPGAIYRLRAEICAPELSDAVAGPPAAPVLVAARVEDDLVLEQLCDAIIGLSLDLANFMH